MSANLAATPAAGRSPVKDAARWTSLSFFSLYRLAVASVFLAAGFFYSGPLNLGSVNIQQFRSAATAYWLLAVVFHLARERLRPRLNRFLSLQVLTDIIAITVMMYASGGYRSGLAVMVLVALAGAGLVGTGRLVILYAALATIALLVEEGYRLLRFGGDYGDFVTVGITGLGFFAIASGARLLGERVVANEELARQRGEDLERQTHINQRVIEDMQDGVLVLSCTGLLRQWNPRAEVLLGVDLGSRRRTAGDISAEFEELVQQWTEVGGEHAVPLRSADGARTLSVRLVPAAAGQDVLVFLEDLGRIEQQARELKLAALGRLTANIAHEIRNPLSAITHAAELLREEKRAETQARLTRIINDNAQRIERLVRDVLELGRRDRAQQEPLNLAGFVEGAVDDLVIQEKTSREAFALAIDAGLQIRFDRVHLGQILWNLLTNALRYCSGQPGCVRMEAFRQASTDRIELHIMDDGPGIPQERRTQVFEPFFTTHNKGTGLGLYIARELADANGAQLELLDSSAGAHFRLLLRSVK